MAGSVRTIIVVGGGIVGWSAAAAIRRRLPQTTVTIVSSPPPLDALADRISSSLPSILDFHADLRLNDTDVILRANSSFRIGTRFEQWRSDGDSYVHAYGDYGVSLGTAAFHQHWLRALASGGAAPFDSYSPGAVIGEANRIIPPEAAQTPPLDACTHGLEINPPRYHDLMRAYALHLGAREIAGTVTDVALRSEDGFIDHVLIEDGTRATGDLFLDCSGPAALLRWRLGGEYDSWASWLPCDRMIIGEAPPAFDPSPLTTATAHPAGWHWQAQSAVRTTLGVAYSSKHLADDQAELLLGVHPDRRTGEAVTLRQGRWAEPWQGNCVAIGDAAVAVEPLEWTNLHLAHSAIDRIIAMMPDTEYAPVELAEYNRQSVAEADRVRDFLLLHYLATDRQEPFWREAAATEPPASLAHTLSLFRERGRLPFYEEETFTRDGWLAVLLGQGVRPRRLDPLVETTPPEQSLLTMARIHESLAALAPRLPTQRAYFQSITRQGAP